LNKVEPNGFQGRAVRFLVVFLLQSGLACWLQSASAQSAAPGKQPGGRLLELCRPAVSIQSQDRASDTRAISDARTCLAFIDGFVWGHAWASWREAKDMWFCLPEGFLAEQGARDVVEYLSAHPDRLDEDSHLLVFLALSKTYPCKP
jgi:hypothetical protein